MAEHDHEHADDETFGIALGFRIIADGDDLFLAEAEIAPYVDAAEELGVTLVFHPLNGVNPIEVDDEVDWPSWPLDIDEDLALDSGAPIEAQFTTIVRQLRNLTDDQLVTYLRQAREEAEAE